VRFRSSQVSFRCLGAPEDSLLVRRGNFSPFRTSIVTAVSVLPLNVSPLLGGDLTRVEIFTTGGRQKFL